MFVSIWTQVKPKFRCRAVGASSFLGPSANDYNRDMATSSATHQRREQDVLSDVEASFPRFTGQALKWVKVPDGQDPPDFLGYGASAPIGLELREWLDGEQMSPAKNREARRNDIRQLLVNGWETEYQPQNFRSAVLTPNFNARIDTKDKFALRQEFYASAKYVDTTWHTNPERTGPTYLKTDFAGYAILAKYVSEILYIGGIPQSWCWFDTDQDAGSFDPNEVVRILEAALDQKLRDYSTPVKQTHLRSHNLAELCLLLHGGINAYLYNRPGHPLSLSAIAQAGANFYASHALRNVFDRVWFFDSLNSADQINQLLGYPPGYGRVRWLAQLWPVFNIYAGSQSD